MKKLKLFGRKGESPGEVTEEFVAVVYVKDGNVVVESPDHPTAAKALQEKLDKYGKLGAFGLGRHREFEIEPGKWKRIDLPSISPDNPDFLEWVRTDTLWITERFDGFKVDKYRSEVVEE